jgi:hypothetical protein
MLPDSNTRRQMRDFVRRGRIPKCDPAQEQRMNWDENVPHTPAATALTLLPSGNAYCLPPTFRSEVISMLWYVVLQLLSAGLLSRT